jgi:hypothetical protein
MKDELLFKICILCALFWSTRVDPSKHTATACGKLDDLMMLIGSCELDKVKNDWVFSD